MIESYANVEYDEKTRRLNRRMKVLGAIVLVLVLGGLIAVIANTGLESAEAAGLFNDTDGTVTCLAAYRLRNDDVQLRDTGRLVARDRGDIVYGSSCSVFDRDGNYVSCLRVRHRSGDSGEQFLASTGDRRVKADACVYPR
jgi:hypothetical protein